LIVLLHAEYSLLAVTMGILLFSCCSLLCLRYRCRRHAVFGCVRPLLSLCVPKNLVNNISHN